MQSGINANFYSYGKLKDYFVSKIKTLEFTLYCSYEK